MSVPAVGRRDSGQTNVLPRGSAEPGVPPFHRGKETSAPTRAMTGNSDKRTHATSKSQPDLFSLHVGTEGQGKWMRMQYRLAESDVPVGNLPSDQASVQ